MSASATVNSRGLQSAGPSSQSYSGPRKKDFKSSGYKSGGPKPEPKTLFQQYFKSVGTRTYAAQLKEAGNGNHFLVLTEGKRDAKTDERKKISLYVFSEDFDQFKNLLRDTFKFIAEHPLPAEFAQKRKKFWAKKEKENATTETQRHGEETRRNAR